MSILYPGAIDDVTTLPPPGPNTVTDTGPVTHVILHDNEILALQALETKLGTGSSTSTISTVLRASSAGTSVWGKLVLTSDVTGVLPAANGGMVPLGTGVATFLGTPSSANLATAMTDETGSGALVFGTSPVITTPTGIVKGDVGLGNVDNTSDATKNSATATFTNKSIDANGTGNSITNIANLSVSRNNNGTTTTVNGARIETGWGFVTVSSGTSANTIAVSYKTTFATAPIVTMTAGGDSVAGTTYGSGGNNVEAIWACKTTGITTSGFTAYMLTARGNNLGSNANVFFQWMAIGS